MTSKAYKNYILILLTSVYLLNLLDRGLLMLLLQSIKEDLGLTDGQLGFIAGMAFSLIYATLGLPIARWADRGNRVTIISAAMVIGGLAVMATTLVTNFVQLVLARMAAAIGEAGSKPPAYSLLGDYFEGPAERTRAMAVYFMGNALASLVSFSLGGWLNERYGWRAAFVFLSVPAIAVALVVRFTVREPRQHVDPLTTAHVDAIPWRAVFMAMWRQRSMRYIALALILLQVMGAGLGPWYAAFLIRSHHFGTAELGLWLGLIFGVAGVVGLLFGSWAATRIFASERGQLGLSAATIAALVPCFLTFLFVPGRQLALASLFPLIVVFYCFIGPTYALMQRLVPTGMRATMLAVILLITNLIGSGVGPQVVGSLSDWLAPQLGDESLRYAMLSMSFVALGSAWCFLQASRTVVSDLRVIESSGDTVPSAPAADGQMATTLKEPCR